MNFVFLMLNFRPASSLFSFTFKRLFNSSSLSAIRVVSSAYLRLLLFLPAILIPAWAHPAQHLMLKLKLQYFSHPMQRVDSLEKTLMLGGNGGWRRRGRQKMSWLDGITDSMDGVWVNSGTWWWTGRPDVLHFMGSQRVGHNWSDLAAAAAARSASCY